MNLLRKLFTNHDAAFDNSTEEVAAAPAKDREQQMPQTNVIQLPTPEAQANLAPEVQQIPMQPKVNGLIGSELVKAFFDQNHFGLGRHNGANYRTLDAMEFGREGRIAEFRNAIRGTVEQTQAKIDRLTSTQIEAQGVCKATSARLALAISQHERDLKVLKEQSELAADGKGWVLEALNRYQAGFVKGVREAVEAELILG